MQKKERKNEASETGSANTVPPDPAGNTRQFPARSPHYRGIGVFFSAGARLTLNRSNGFRFRQDLKESGVLGPVLCRRRTWAGVSRNSYSSLLPVPVPVSYKYVRLDWPIPQLNNSGISANTNTIHTHTLTRVNKSSNPVPYNCLTSRLTRPHLTTYRYH